MDNTQGSRKIDFEFNGKAGEYFKIWIVNIALSILTLGIYSAWAKVRTKRYFYGNTTLDGSSFEYLANPISILIGRLIVVAFIAAYALTTKFVPMLEFVFIIIYMLALPWVVIKSLQFNARNSSYRNIRFNFDSTLKEAAIVFIALPLFCLITLGLAIPYFIKRVKQFTVEHSYFGSSKFNFDATGASFYMIYLKALIVPIIGIVLAVAIPIYADYTQTQSQPKNIDLVENTQVVEQIEQTENSATNLEEPIAEDNAQTLSNNQAQTSMPPQGDFDSNNIIIVSTLISMMLYLLIIIYIQTRTINLVFASSTVKGHQFESRLRVRNMFYIYISNILVIIVSLGLMIPWCTIRLARYRLKNMSLIASGSLDDFIANQQNEVKATASEFVDAFDVDLGL